MLTHDPGATGMQGLCQSPQLSTEAELLQQSHWDRGSRARPNCTCSPAGCSSIPPRQIPVLIAIVADQALLERCALNCQRLQVSERCPLTLRNFHTARRAVQWSLFTLSSISSLTKSIVCRVLSAHPPVNTPSPPPMGTMSVWERSSHPQSVPKVA